MDIKSSRSCRFILPLIFIVTPIIFDENHRSSYMIREKINQAIDILKEENIDCWLTFVRETSTIHDPAMDLVVGSGVTWHSAFIITARGDTLAIVGSLDKPNQETLGHYRKIVGYLESIEKDLTNALQEIKQYLMM